MKHLKLGMLGLTIAMAPLSYAVTMEELHELQKNRYAESLKEPSDKDRAARAPNRIDTSSHIPPQAIVAGTAAKEMRLTGLYGVANDIEARIAYRGASIPLKLGMDIDGWVLTDIGERTVKLTKSSGAHSRGKAKPKTITLRIASVVREYPATPSAIAAGSAPVPLPTSATMQARRSIP